MVRNLEGKVNYQEGNSSAHAENEHHSDRRFTLSLSKGRNLLQQGT